MKNLLKLSLTLIVLTVVFSACKKDAQDLENSYMNIITSEDGLWAAENDIRYVANLSPGTLTGEKVTVTYTSEADPTGISVEASYWNDELTSGRDVYKVQQIDRSFYVAAETNIEKNRLKVNPDGDKVTITIGDNLFTETVDFKKKYEPLIVADITQGVTGGIHGHIYYYNETGERPDITMYSESDPTLVTVSADDELYDNGFRPTDVESGYDFGRTYYPVTLVTNHEEALGYDYEVNVNYESDTFYVKIGDKTYSVPVEGETLYLTIMSPAQ